VLVSDADVPELCTVVLDGAKVPPVAVVPRSLSAGNAEPGEAVGDGVDVVSVRVSDAEVTVGIDDVTSGGVDTVVEVEVLTAEDTLSV